jgi:hypothetical protein
MSNLSGTLHPISVGAMAEDSNDNPLERIPGEVRQRTRVVGNYPDGNSALMFVAARLRHVKGTEYG